MVLVSVFRKTVRGTRTYPVISVLVLSQEMDASPLLLCDEELLLSPSSPSASPSSSPLLRHRDCSCQRSAFLQPCSDITEEEWRSVFEDYVHKEHLYVPCLRYSERLQSRAELLAARFRAVRWIILACGRLNLALGTAFNAVNYLDRFISRNCDKKWEWWMMELLSIACVSIASKLDEVLIPSLHDIQMEDLKHTFEPKAIKQMETTVLEVLEWRLLCVTPNSYVDLLTSPPVSFDCLTASRVTELLLFSLLDCRFLDFKAHVVAASVLRCGLHGAPGAGSVRSLLSLLIPEEHVGLVEQCCKLMQEVTTSCMKNHECPPSPVTVIPTQKTKLFGCYIDIDGFYNEAEPSDSFKKMKS